MAETAELLNRLRTGFWFFGLGSWSFGICDRTIAAVSDGFLSAIDIMQLATASFFAMGWFLLKPRQQPDTIEPDFNE
ncbi:hypothetical protein IQ241_15930 [Romeria aff. gracilis LEGE 07310]|uniref:Uncharacterized protein n=1 Tax=Vasconcelosia minhoensis LEGE 07310 TaxID=915328 RepID=A0A8J7A811_9CYAN|nr:hypothetical protein [Romeria aff. gracilis LEGE 07310]